MWKMGKKSQTMDNLMQLQIKIDRFAFWGLINYEQNQTEKHLIRTTEKKKKNGQKC